jgi:protein-disulfide isomerase
MSKKNRESSRRVREMQATQRASERRRRNLIVGGAVIAVIVIVVGLAIAVQSGRDDTGAGSQVPRNVDGAGTTAAADYSIVRGDANAPVTVTLFEDFQCPVCKQYEAWLADTITKDVDAGTVKVVYRPMAFLDNASTTDYSSRAGATAACVLDQDGVDTWVQLHQLLFENQPEEGSAGLSDSELAALAEQAGADKSEVESCQSDGTFEGWVRAATDAASKDKVTGTPTMRIDGDDVPLTSAQDQAAAIKLFSDAVAAAHD